MIEFSLSQSVSQCTEAAAAAVVVIIVSLVDAFHNSNISNEIKFLGPYVPCAGRHHWCG